MEEQSPAKKIQRRSRNNLALSEKSVRRFFLSSETRLPLVFQAEYPGLDLKAWITENRSRIQEELNVYGAILFRNFSTSSVRDFEEAARAWKADLMDYDFGSTPRRNLQAGIYTSTEYPADQEIAMHNEMSYSKHYPAYLWFYCQQAAEEGGCTPLADSRQVYQMLDKELVRQFESQKIQYCRNYKPGIDVPWTAVFQTEDRGEVEAFCKANGIECEWVSENHLRTRELCPAVLSHPQTGEKVWFNQAHLFHISNLSEDLASQLAMMPEEDLPRNVYWEDGSSIGPEQLQKIRQTFERAKARFDWQPGDLLLIDNLLAAHGRDAYKGPRKILVAMQGALVPRSS